MQQHNALVLFSGGQDSTTCLAQALTCFEHVETLGLDYGQRHHCELNSRLVVLEKMRRLFPQWSDRLGDDHVFSDSILRQMGSSALTSEAAFAMQQDGLPNTFVPGRNLLFLTLAAALAYRRSIGTIFLGVSESDYSGYPDCRDNTIRAMQVALSLGLDRPIAIETPLMDLDKAQTWAMAYQLGGQALLELIIEDTHTCYMGNRTNHHPWGWGCGQCAACRLRQRGWENFSLVRHAMGQRPPIKP